MKILLFFLLLSVTAIASNVAVITQTGIVIGSTIGYQGKSVERFLGIPFAEPPVGELRFRKTVPAQPWTKPLVANTFPPSCVQYYPFNYPYVDKMPGKSEDCLYLNIWVPQNASRRNPKAVMFWIFSGGFSSGSNRLPVYDGHVLAAEGDVIVVSVNYRVGSLGFLYTNTEDAPGNMGLYDVLEALKWINNNIQAFGGDRDRITVFGNSAGGSISGFLTVSPLSNGLFQRIILQSGYTLRKVEKTKEANLDLGQKVAKSVGCASEEITLEKNPKEVVACLRNVDAHALIFTERNLLPLGAVETFIPTYGDIFLPVDPLKAFMIGIFKKVDVLVGHVKDEGSEFLVSTAPEFCGPYGELHPKINKTKGTDLIHEMFKDDPFKQDVANYYLSGLNEYDYDVVRSQVYHSKGDSEIVCPSIYLAEKFSERVKNVYYYYFTHQNLKTVYAPWMGATHFTEVDFVFGRPLENPSSFTEGEVELSKTIVELWSNFAKVGFPSLEWKTYSKSDPYVKEFYVQKVDGNYLKQHQENCEFFRPYFGF